MVGRGLIAFGFAASLALTALAPAQERAITIASTTSTEQSGLFAHLLPRFTAKTGIAAKVVALGTGQSTSAGAATPTWSSFTIGRRRRSSSPKVLA